MTSYQGDFTPPQYRLRRQDLVDLVHLINECIPSEREVRIVLRHPELEQSFDSLDALLAFPELPSEPDDLVIQIWIPDPQARRLGDPCLHSISVALRAGILGNSVHVSGADSTWVQGASARIAKFFINRRPRFAGVASFIRSGLRSPELLAVLIALWIGLLDSLSGLQPAYRWLARIAGAYLVLRFAGRAFTIGMPRAGVLLAEGHRGILGMTPKEVVSIAIALAALIVSIVGLFVKP